MDRQAGGKGYDLLIILSALEYLQGKQCDLFERMGDPSLVEEFRILPDQKRPLNGKAS